MSKHQIASAIIAAAAGLWTSGCTAQLIGHDIAGFYREVRPGIKRGSVPPTEMYLTLRHDQSFTLVTVCGGGAAASTSPGRWSTKDRGATLVLAGPSEFDHFDYDFNCKKQSLVERVTELPVRLGAGDRIAIVLDEDSERRLERIAPP